MKRIISLAKEVIFSRPWYAVVEIEVISFIDASFNINPRQLYGQTGMIIGIRYRGRDDSRCFHPTHWAIF